MNNLSINNYRMAAYAAIAVGLINLRYQSGATDNLVKSTTLILPGILLFVLTITPQGKKALKSRTAAVATTICGGLLLFYSFII